MPGKRWFLYALRDPISWDVRYVGKTVDLRRRYQRHLNESPRGGYRCGRWIATVLRQGLLPMLETLDTGYGTGHAAGERAWIAEMRRRGYDLTNTATGGMGGSGPCSTETRRKLSDAQRGKPRSPESIARMVATKTGQRQPEAVRLKRAASLKGRVVSAITREKIAATKRGKPRSPETIAKLAAAATGKRLSPETLAKMQAGHRAYWERKRAQ